MKYCPSCGTERVARFCAGCGFDFDASPLDSQTLETNNAEEVGAPSSAFDVEPAGGDSPISSDPGEEKQPPPTVPDEDEAEKELIEPDSVDVELEQEPQPDSLPDLSANAQTVDEVAQENSDTAVELSAGVDDSEPTIGLTEGEEANSEFASGTESQNTAEQEKTAKQVGWYVDPINSARFRFWDGAAWTDRIALKAGDEPVEPDDEPAVKTINDLPSPVILEGLSYGKKYRAGSSCFNCGFTPEERTNFCEVCGVDLKPRN